MIKDFKFFNEDANCFDKFFHLTMKEGLIRSVEYDIFSEKLKNTLDNFECEYDIKTTDKYVKLIIDVQNINKKHFEKQLSDIVNNMGYFESKIIDFDNFNEIKSLSFSKNKKFLIFFQKRFDVPQNTPDRLYHATTKHYYEKIKKTGLTTKSQKMISNDLDRLYLTDNLAEALDFCTQKRFFYKQKYNKIKKFDMNIDDWVILEIDISSIPDIKLYKDEKMDNSYYTYDFIPWYAVKIFEEINF
ncbi:hypothetical protein M0Q97_10735 [Candidatus Dojkabacteria bacterium]|jgi:hypothetical protein|nr:hypothetical protein [Candidatus Dojkabacteria bacterium]